MSKKEKSEIDDQEIDLSVISEKIGNFFAGISTSIYNFILFIKRNLVLLAILFVVGVVLGYFLDKTTKVYDHQIIVSPNFGSVDYLYNKIDLLQSKINNGDTIFLKSIGIEHPKNIALIEVDPIIDIYAFVNDKNNATANAQNSQNFELVKLLSEDGDIKKVVKDNMTSKNYGHHTIHVVTTGFVTDKNTIDPILNFLNQNNYFLEIQKSYINNIVLKMKESQIIINQIDALLNQFSTTTANNQKSDKLVYYNENTQLNEIIQTKNTLVNEQGYHRLQLIELNKVIKDNSRVTNIKNTKGLNNKMKLVLPFIFIFGFLIVTFILTFYRKQTLKASKLK